MSKMDFKDLLKLAKDNQSYIQKKHEREKQVKEKVTNDKANELDKRKKALLQKKERELQLKKEANRLEAQKRIIEKRQAQLELEAAENKKKFEKLQKGATQTNGIARKRKEEDIRDVKSTHQTGRSGKRPLQQNQKQAINGGPPRIHSRGDSSTQRESNIRNMKRNADPSKSIRQPSSSGLKQDSSKKSNLSFQELMQLAKKQQNKTVSGVESEGRKPLKLTDRHLQSATPAAAIEKRTKQINRINQETSRSMGKTQSGGTACKGRPTNVMAQGARSSAHAKSNNGAISRTGPSKLNAFSDSNHRSASSNEQATRKRKLRDLDDELEQKRRDIERQKRMLENKYRRGYEAEEDCYESDLDGDLDDFIDDSDSNVNVSKYIQEIFGYKRSNYDDNEDDLRCMESNYRQIQQEEARSSRIGKMEDEIERIREQKMLAKEKKLTPSKKR